MINRVTTAFAFILMTGAAFGGTDMNFPIFTGITVKSGTNVVLHHGPQQRVTIVKGNAAKANLRMSGSTLVISPCKGWCFQPETLQVEIVSPRIDDIRAYSGSDFKAVGTFPRQPALHIEAQSGSDIDSRAIPAEAINATVHSGADAYVNALDTLNAAVQSGGDLTYIGAPKHMTTDTHSGGSIHKQ